MPLLDHSCQPRKFDSSVIDEIIHNFIQTLSEYQVSVA